MNVLHLCFGIGAMVTPLLVNRSLHIFDSVWGVALPMAALTAVCASLMMHTPRRCGRDSTPWNAATPAELGRRTSP